MEMIATGVYSFVMSGLERSDESRKRSSEGISESVRVNRVCDITTKKEYSTAKFLAKDQIREERLLREKTERVCDILTRKEYSAHSFKVMLTKREKKSSL